MTNRITSRQLEVILSRVNNLMGREYELDYYSYGGGYRVIERIENGAHRTPFEQDRCSAREMMGRLRATEYAIYELELNNQR